MKLVLNGRLSWFVRHGQRLALVLAGADLSRRILCNLIYGSDLANPLVVAGEGVWPTLACGAAILLALLRFGDPIVADRQAVFGAKPSSECAAD